ncbi:MAG: hypothetical protein FWG92_02790 [Leptospirales bacterium]|nr:hypothetical protein [Leptospirales bacterium]
MNITNDIIIGKFSGNNVLILRGENVADPNSEKQRIIDELKIRDKEVKAHEMSHGTDPNLIKIGSPQFDYTIGPDGKAYATGGKVILSTGRPSSSEDALAKAESLKRAAMSPGDPSPQDFQALNAATAMASEAQNNLYSNKNKLNNAPLTKGANFNIYA